MKINNLPDGVKVAIMCSSCFLNTKLQLDNILTVKRLIELKKNLNKKKLIKTIIIKMVLYINVIS